MGYLSDFLTLKIAKHALGKYIILFATLLHLFWAVLVAIDIHAGNATSLSILFALCDNSRAAVIALLFSVALAALLFLDRRVRVKVGNPWMTLLLLPQQLILWLSAGAGIYAVSIQRYADGIVRSWAHISADQVPMVLTALLYTVAVLEATRSPAIMDS
jgi:hypothetical protein